MSHDRPISPTKFRIVAWLKPVAIALALLGITPSTYAARVAAPKLLPKNTYLYLQVANVPELVETFQQTNLGRMIADPQIKPFVEKLYAAGKQALEQVKERTGFSLEELASIPKGEITFAAMPMEGNQFAMVLIVDCGEPATTKKLVDKLYQMSAEFGGAPREETADGVTLLVNQPTGPVQFVYFEHDSAVVLTSGIDTAKQLLAKWNQGATKDSLAENARFEAIMNRCRGTKDEAPQVVFFADPMEWAWEISKQSPGMQIGLRMLPALGLDGLKGLGGSLVLATEDFDSIIHLHLLLDNPRSGVLELLTLDSGDDTPPAWVPDDIGQYNSWHANLKEAFEKGTKLADTFRLLDEGTTANRLNDRAKDMLGVSVTGDLLPAITGRLVQINRFNPNPQVGLGPENLYAIELRDPKEFVRTFDKVLDQIGDRFEKHAFAGTAYYRQTVERNPDDPRPLICFIQLDEWLLIADRPSIMEHILSGRDETSNRLASALEFKLIASKIARQSGGERPAMMKFDRPEAGWKYLYDLAQAERTKQRLRDGAANNPVYRALNEGLTDNPLPPWSAMSKYLAPQGGMIVNDDSGIHFMQFSLRRK